MIKDELSILQVIDSLEVGPAKVEPQRIIAPYRIIQNSKEDRTELIYRYEEKVFEPGEEDDENLANMMAAQIALNYGLFCKQIVFHGLYDEKDQHFLLDMAENTAREIFVKKFLEHNPFLVGEVAHLPPLKKKSYLQAELKFPNLKKWKSKPWQSDSQKYTVLSSGGKDSLLTFGVLQEIGKEVHPLFVNESGRHWFTALNAYRYFCDNIPNTGRVWVNSDRIFNWMLRHFPFIRPDFLNLRSDEYPIRLWTVAVFIFGILPLVRKRRIGRVVLGDEFDCTYLMYYKGIPHYNGLYDQSGYFDNALSLYYQKKEWNLCQFSILRPLSEMLIEKILSERYPELQAHQVSCHAAHKEGDRFHPCGNCEKCRRIVGMLLCIGKDPTHCGYSEKQIEHCRKEIEKKAVSQETPGVEHLLYCLLQKKLIATAPLSAREHPEILQLRFHPKHSRREWIPQDIQSSIFSIYLEHALGAVTYQGKHWLDFNPLQP